MQVIDLLTCSTWRRAFATLHTHRRNHTGKKDTFFVAKEKTSVEKMDDGKDTYGERDVNSL